MNTPKMTLNLIRQYTKTKREDMAERMGLSSGQQVYKQEARPNPTVRTLRRYVDALGGEVIILVKIDGVVFELDLPEETNPKAP